MPTDEDWRYVNNVYDAGVARMDDVVMAFIEGIEAIFADEPFLLIFSSDHGEEINDHGVFGHAHVLYEEVTRVPLIVHFPEGSRVGRSAEPTSGLDLVPTMLDFAGLERPSYLSGFSLRNELPRDRVRITEQWEKKGRHLKFKLYYRGATFRARNEHFESVMKAACADAKSPFESLESPKEEPVSNEEPGPFDVHILNVKQLVT